MSKPAQDELIHQLQARIEALESRLEGADSTERRHNQPRRGSAPPHTTGSALSRATLLRVAVAGMAGIAGGAVLAQGSRADARVTPAHTRRAGNGYETYSYVAEGETIGDDGYNLGAFYEVDQTGPSALATYHNGVLVYGNVTGVTGYLTEGGPYGAVAGVLGEAQTYANFTGNFQNATHCGGVSPGVKGRSGSGAGVFGTSISTTPTTYTTDIADATGPGIGVLGTSHSGVGVSGISQTAAGVTGTSQSDTGVIGTSTTGDGVDGNSSAGIGVSGGSINSTGVYGLSINGDGVSGATGSSESAGVRAENTGSGHGVFAKAGDGDALHGTSTTGHGAVGISGGSDGVAGQTSSAGNNGVSGTCSAADGNGVYGLGPIGVLGQGTTGVRGSSDAGHGLEGFSNSSNGVSGTSQTGRGGSFGGGTAQINLVPAKKRGKPTAGAHIVGDLYLDTVGTLFICIKAGTPGKWAKVNVTPV